MSHALPAPCPDEDVVWRLPETGSGHQVSLLVLPHAGGNAHAYASWRDALPSEVRMLIGQYPGRGARFAEPLPTTMADLAGPVVHALPQDIDNLVILGHSMGALVAFEVARALTAAGRPPRALVASACRAPFLPNPAKVHPERLTDDELVAAIKERGGTEDGVLDEPELREIVLPSLRADFALDDDYRHEGPVRSLSCPVTVIGGREDPIVPVSALGRWSGVTDGPCSTATLPGGHFYFQQQDERFFALLQEVLDRAATAPADRGALV